MTEDSNRQTSSLSRTNFKRDLYQNSLDSSQPIEAFDFDIEKDITIVRKNALPTVLNESVFVILKWQSLKKSFPSWKKKSMIWK